MGPPVGLRPMGAEAVAAGAAEGLGPETEEEDKKVLAKMRTGTGGPPVCRTTGLVTRKHFSLCALSMLEKRKRWPHTSQGYGFSPVWVRRWRFMLGRLVKLFPQISQMKGFSPAQIEKIKRLV